MANVGRYYVYRHYIGDNTFYVGKGQEGRANVTRQRNKVWQEFAKDGYEIEILKYFNNERDALDYEHEMQEYYWSIGQCKACLNYTEEWRNNIRNAIKGKKRSEEYRMLLSEKIKGENNPFFGKKHTEETKRKISETLKLKSGSTTEETLKKLSKASAGSNNPRAQIIIMKDLNDNIIKTFKMKKEAVDYIYNKNLTKYSKSGIGNKLHEAIENNLDWLGFKWYRYNKKEYMEVINHE